jgi:hypothetical protein
VTTHHNAHCSKDVSMAWNSFLSVHLSVAVNTQVVLSCAGVTML